jgi:F-type H+-transporting ATPase subunit gamma
MATLKDIKRRIGTVKNTGKITQAMKLVSAAKFARASHAVSASRPFSKTFSEVVAKVVASGINEDDSPLLRKSDEKKVLLVLIATDRGLCGSLNSNLFKRIDPFLKEKREKGVAVDVAAWGRRSTSYAKRKEGVSIIQNREKVLDKPTYADAKKEAKEYIDKFTDGEYDAVYIAYNIFESALSQSPVIDVVLPVVVEPEASDAEVKDSNVIMEPEKAELIPSLLNKKVGFQVFQAVLDAAASEHGARMSAMDSATRNSKEVEKKLTIQYNRARQAAITKELIEIVSGAEAL